LGAEYLDPAYGELAVEYGLKGVKVERYGPAIRFQLARALMRLGRLDEAREHLQIAVDLDQNYGDAWVLLGDVTRMAGDLPAARDAYTKALVLQPTLTNVQSSLAAVEASIAAGN
ncbi:MAG: tetratricopeptide repeat protein, partial [Actinomycetota bacterium]|nr:tetratricopeptide repeat protein [Actinomycetota bacterium]